LSPKRFGSAVILALLLKTNLVNFILGFAAAAAIITPVTAVLVKRSILKKNANKLEELSMLTGGLAHEIKNPLSTIKINLKLISEDLDSGDAKLARPLKKIATVQKESDRLEQILDDFLRYIGRTELQPAAADVNEIVSDMADFFSPQAYTNSITVRLGLSKEPLNCRVDKLMIKQVLLNLLLNAQQAMPSGGELIIRTSRRRGDAVIEISDTGVGIEKEKLGRIFDAYYSSRPSGRGLGLPTAKKIIEQHNGIIMVSSEVGKGSSFSIRLPMVKI
jgi:signal transduction histidine kinase